jgi:TolB protein
LVGVALDGSRSGRYRRTLTFAGCAGLVVAAAASVAVATTPGPNGRIAFRRYLNADQTASAFYTMTPDGTDVRQIWRSPRHTVDDQPDWSPDGTKLVFTREPQDSPFAVGVMNADGSGVRQVTPRCAKRATPAGVPRGCEDAGEASFAPDGQHVTFTRVTGRVRKFPKYDWEQIEHAAVAIIGLDGSGERELYRVPPYAADIHWAQMSPDGRLILFERQNSPLSRPRLAHAVFVMNADGTNVHRITPWSLNAGDNSDWAPDGSRILTRSNQDVDDERSQYYTVRPDGTGLTQLTRFPHEKGRRLFSASFSPDGTQIVFARSNPNGARDMWEMNADGSNQRRVLASGKQDSGADWGPAP